MTGKHYISRRDFVRLTTATVGAVMSAVIGLPIIGYLIDPALKSQSTDAWIPLGEMERFEIGKPTLVNFTRTQVNGWEKTVNSYGVFVLRKTADETIVLFNQCTHLSCRVNWDEVKQAYLCPCHDAQFDLSGNVLSGPPPRPLDKYEGSQLKIEDGILYLHFMVG